MHMKKILSVILAAAAVFTMGTAVFAEAEKTDSADTATISFDTDKALDYVHAFGNYSQSGLVMEITDAEKVSGKALSMSESFKGNLDNRYGGFYLDSADFGLDSFAGHTITMNVYITKAASKATEKLEAFSDGSQWTSVPVLSSPSDTWTKASITIAANSANTKAGISIPITEEFTGTVCYVDDITITDNYGKTVANIGDIDNSLYQGPSGLTSVLTTILFIVLIIAVVGGIALFIKKVVGTYR